MLRILLGALLAIRNVFQRLAGRLFNKLRDPKTGKFSGIHPKTISTLAWILFVLFFVVALGSKLLLTNNGTKNGSEIFRKEMTPRLGVNIMPPDDVKVDLNFELNRIGQEASEYSPMREDPQTESIKKPTPSKEELDNILLKINNGEALSGDERARAMDILSDVGNGLSEDQINYAKKLIEKGPSLSNGVDLNQKTESNSFKKSKISPSEEENLRARLMDPNLSPEERAIVERALSGDATPEELATAKRLSSQNISPEERVKIIAASQEKANKNKDSINPSELAMAADSIKKESDRLRTLESELIKAQSSASDVGKKLADGVTLSESDQVKINKIADLQNEISKIKESIRLKKDDLSIRTKTLKDTLYRVESELDGSTPSMFSEEFEEEETLDPAGKSISPEKLNLLRIKRRKMVDVSRAQGPSSIAQKPEDQFKANKDTDKIEQTQPNPREELTSGLNSGDSLVSGAKQMSQKDVFAQMGNGGGTNLSELVVYSNKALKEFQLSPDMKIPAILSSKVLISDKGRPQVVRVVVLSDVYEPSSSRLAIPKGSVAIGTTSGFDSETGIMDMSFDKISVGSGKIVQYSFNVGSADGSFGLKGEVRDNKGKLLLGAFISSFSSGALNWFSQSVTQQFLQSVAPTDALLGAASAGAGESAQRFSDFMTSELMNASKVFYAPKGIPLVLYPQ